MLPKKIQQIIKDNIFALLEGEVVELDHAKGNTLYIDVKVDGMDQTQKYYWVKVNCRRCFGDCYWSDLFLVNEFGEVKPLTRA